MLYVLCSRIVSFQHRVTALSVFCQRNAVVVIVARWRRFPRMIRLNRFTSLHSWHTRLEWRTSCEKLTDLGPVSWFCQIGSMFHNTVHDMWSGSRKSTVEVESSINVMVMFAFLVALRLKLQFCVTLAHPVSLGRLECCYFQLQWHHTIFVCLQIWFIVVLCPFNYKSTINCQTLKNSCSVLWCMFISLRDITVVVFNVMVYLLIATLHMLRVAVTFC